MKSILLVHEFPASVDEWMMPGLQNAIQRKNPDARVFYFHGLFRKYHPGTLHPPRLLNLLYMSLILPLVLLVKRPSLSIIRSAPVGLHLWGAFWLRLFRLQGACWLMDYHPEIEIQSLSGKGWASPLVSLLKKWDRFALMSYREVVVLDPAMQLAVRSRCPECETVIFPTWPKQVPQEIKIDWQNFPDTGQSLNLLYGGHLGTGHDMSPFPNVLKELSSKSLIKILVVGANEEGIERFRGACHDLANVELEILPRTPFEALPDLARDRRIHFGLVFMKKELGGLLSPSKFSGYLAAGIPVIYCGPRDTNADRVCREFGAGIAIFEELGVASSEHLSDELLSHSRYRKLLKGVQKASDYYFSFTPAKLADLIIR